MPWIDLETVKLSEVRQKKRNIWYHLYVKSLLKNDTNELMVTGRSGLEG